MVKMQTCHFCKEDPVHGNTRCNRLLIINVTIIGLSGCTTLAHEQTSVVVRKGKDVADLLMFKTTVEKPFASRFSFLK